MPPATEADAKTDNSSGAKQGGKNEQDAASAKPRSKKPPIILGAVVVIAAIAAFIVWFVHRNQVSTDDAYTDGNVITMAPKVSGYLDAYRHGLFTYVTVLTLQLQTVQARQQLAQASLTQIIDLIKLYKALGGGWQGSPAAPAL